MLRIQCNIQRFTRVLVTKHTVRVSRVVCSYIPYRQKGKMLTRLAFLTIMMMDFFCLTCDDNKISNMNKEDRVSPTLSMGKFNRRILGTVKKDDENE